MNAIKSEKSPFAEKYHRDGTVTIWDVYTQQWCRTGNPSDSMLATLGYYVRERVLRHVGRNKSKEYR